MARRALRITRQRVGYTRYKVRARLALGPGAVKKRIPCLRLVLTTSLLFASSGADGEDAVTVWGNYYKERSTRVLAPMVRISKDLPQNSEFELSYLVDQITSASSAVTAVDEVFQEYRQELTARGQWGALDLFKPGLVLRYSKEPDYQSAALGLSLALELEPMGTVVTLRGQHQRDQIRQREVRAFEDKLSTTLVGLDLSQIVRRNVVLGASFEAQIVRGYQENPYRNEVHPRSRNRYATAIFGAYRHEPSRTSVRLEYRFYIDTWNLHAHSVAVEIHQWLWPGVEIAPQFRWHTQDGVRFESGFRTSDPKLAAFDSRFYGLQIRWTLSFLRETFLSTFAESSLEPSYAYLDQDNAYGPAHIAQLGWYWPF